MSTNESKENCREATSGLTNRKRFAFGLDLAYFITFPLGIHSVRMQKQRGSLETETPNKGKMFGWDKCFQLIISRHNRWVKSKQWRCTGLSEGTLKILSESPSYTLRRLTATRRPKYSPSLTSAGPPWYRTSPTRMRSHLRTYEVGIMLRALQILERSRKLRRRSLLSRDDRVRTCFVVRPSVSGVRCTWSTHLVEKIDKGLSIVSSEAPNDVHVGSTAQE